MTDKEHRELDAEVAKIMGWKRFHDVYKTPDGKRVYVSDIPHYSTSIADAWTVVEKIKANWEFTVHSFGKRWSVVIMRETGPRLEDFIRFHITSDSITEGICRIALKAIGGEE